MPSVGESDMGLFSLSPEAYFELLPEFSLEAAQAPQRASEISCLSYRG
jgi:hypothetical protein